jgi:hypothetical protein
LKVTGIQFQPFVRSRKYPVPFALVEFKLEEATEKTRMADLRCYSAERGIIEPRPGDLGRLQNEFRARQGGIKIFIPLFDLCINNGIGLIVNGLKESMPICPHPTHQLTDIADSLNTDR